MLWLLWLLWLSQLGLYSTMLLLLSILRSLCLTRNKLVVWTGRISLREAKSGLIRMCHTVKPELMMDTGLIVLDLFLCAGNCLRMVHQLDNSLNSQLISQRMSFSQEMLCFAKAITLCCLHHGKTVERPNMWTCKSMTSEWEQWRKWYHTHTLISNHASIQSEQRTYAHDSDK